MPETSHQKVQNETAIAYALVAQQNGLQLNI